MEPKEKWLHTMAVYGEYEKRFAKATADRPFNIPTTEAEQRNIINGVKRMLAYDEALMPEIGNFEELRRDVRDCYDVVQLRYTTWENFHSAATLFMPHTDNKVPLTFVFCGHGKDGRLTQGYQLMADRLARMGMAVMVPDNIGQGDRRPLGHDDVIAPFYCGLTLQGMILLESVALIRHMINKPWVDKERVGACGNSGGGTLCLFLAALCPELTVLCPTGYPSDFSYILAKERRHCACNLLLGCSHGPEMWEILSCFAPKPLLISQGSNDMLIPYDLFMRTARKVGHVYRRLDGKNNFSAKSTPTTHSWTSFDRDLITQFIAQSFGLSSDGTADDESLPPLLSSWHVTMPQGGLTTEALAEKLSGKKMPEGTLLSDIFKPSFDGRPIDKDDIIPDIGRGDVMRVLAQMECALLETEER